MTNLVNNVRCTTLFVLAPFDGKEPEKTSDVGAEIYSLGSQASNRRIDAYMCK